MNKYQNSRQNSNRSVILVCDDAINVWQNQPGFVAAYDAYKVIFGNINTQAQKQETGPQGATASKEAAWNVMANTGNVIRSKVQNYASVAGKEDLFVNVNFSFSKLRKTRTNKAIDRANIIHAQATAELANLANYGVTQQSLDDYQDIIDIFEGLAGAPKRVISERKSATDILKRTLFKRCEKVLNDQLDKAMENFKESAPQFYADYFNARRLDDPGYFKTEIDFTVVEAGNQSPLNNALITAKSPERTYTTSTNGLGIGEISEMEPELYDITVEVAGYEKVIIKNIDMDPGEKERLTVEMVKI
ncbi:MAG: carboxypeptidase-like regulatory domain-containing protein [Bacteroidia bacterium]